MFKKIKIKIFLAVLIILAVLIFFMYKQNKANENMIFGVSFNPAQARLLKEDPKLIYDFLTNDLKFKYVRLSAQWNEIEQTRGQYDFSELDYYISQSEKRGVKVLLAVGRKTPRWPECHLPPWAENLKYEDYRADLLKYMEAVVGRYKNSFAVEIWQVENEPFFVYGKCGKMSVGDLREEINLVKKISPDKKTLTTDSGEMGFWITASRTADLFGTTMYRVVWNKYFGYWKYDWLPPNFYNWKLKLLPQTNAEAFISELQAEPWLLNNNPNNTILADQYKSMDANRLQKNIDFAKSTNFSRSYLWGAEWWYWLKNKDTAMADKIFEIIKGVKKE